MNNCESCGRKWIDDDGIIRTCKRNGEQAEEIARLNKANWILIRDQLPPTDMQVLFCCEIDGDFTEIYLGQFNGTWAESKNAVAMELDGDDWAPCSHWRELPKPPQKQVS